MAGWKPRSGRSTALRGTSESRMDSAGSWDALEWTKIETEWACQLYLVKATIHINYAGSLPLPRGQAVFWGHLCQSSIATSAAQQSPGPSHTQISSDSSPIFFQWVDCISQLLRMYPLAFEYSMDFLLDFLDCMLSCLFGNFLCNSEKERQQAGGARCLWMFMGIF